MKKDEPVRLEDKTKIRFRPKGHRYNWGVGQSPNNNNNNKQLVQIYTNQPNMELVIPAHDNQHTQTKLFLGLQIPG